MKKVIIALLVIVYGIIFLRLGAAVNRYDVVAEVLSNRDGIVTIKDEQDEFWEYYGNDVKGDVLKVTFFDNTTIDRYDDKIVNVKKVAHRTYTVLTPCQ